MLKKNIVISLVALFCVSCASTSNVEVVQLKKLDSSSVTKVYIADLGGMKDGVKSGATISVDFGFANNAFKTKGSTSGTLAKTINDIRSYKIALCTDPTKPLASGIGTFPIDRDGSVLTTPPHVVTFVNVPPNASPYYAVIEAFDATGGTGNSLIKSNNGSLTPYGTPDMGANVAVSSNSVLVGTNLSLTFAPITPNLLSVTANLKDGVGANVETQVIPVNGIIDGNADTIPDTFTVQ